MIGFLADLHIANHRKWGQPSRGTVAPINTRAADILRVLVAARREAEQLGVTDLFVLGDVFDTSSPSPQLIAETQNALTCTLDGKDEMRVHLMIGNHDQQSDAEGDHALVSMDGYKGLHVYAKPQIVYTPEHAVYLVPYRPGRADEYLPDVVKNMGSTGHDPYTLVLGLHLGMRDAETQPWLQNAHDSFPVRDLDNKFDLVAAGNWHERKRYMDGRVWQVGALVPTGFDNPGLQGYGTLLMHDGSKARVRELAGPRFLRVTGLAGARALFTQAMVRDITYPLYVSVRCRLDERQDVQELFELSDHKLYELLTDKDAAEDAARSAATAAAYASTDGIQSAVRAYVDRMALPADIDRDTVRSKALDYIAGAAE